MQKLLMLVGVLSLAGCGGGGADELGPMRTLTKQMCACTTKDCVDTVKTAMKAFENTLEAKYKGKEPPKSVENAWEKLEDEAKECTKVLRAKLEAAAPAPAPTEPAAPAPVPAPAPAPTTP